MTISFLTAVLFGLFRIPFRINIMLLLLPLILNSVGTLARESGLRIIGGDPVSITERPFQVLIYRKGTKLVPGCGGAIIHKRWILTAAHCTVEIPDDSITVRVGSDNVENTDGAQWFDIVKVISHEGYSDSQSLMTNDIALMMVDREIEFGPNIQPIKVRSVAPEPEMEGVVSGFGVTEEGGSIMSGIMREVSVRVIEKELCKDLILKTFGPTAPGVSDTHFCAADLDGGRDACQGDSGGPITIGDDLAGIVSWGIGCGRKMLPAFYTDVAQFIPWIDENMKQYTERKYRGKQVRPFAAVYKKKNKSKRPMRSMV